MPSVPSSEEFEALVARVAKLEQRAIPQLPLEVPLPKRLREFVGVNVHLGWTSDPVFGKTDAAVQWILDLGVGRFRDRAGFSSPVKANAVETLAAQGVLQHGTVGVLGDTVADIDKLVASIGLREHVFASLGGPNEPNADQSATWPDRLRTHVMAVAAALDRFDVALPLAAPSLKDNVPDVFADYRRMRYALEGVVHDYSDLHRYPRGEYPGNGFLERFEACQLPGTSRTLMTETGYNTSTAPGGGVTVPEAVQATYVVKMVLESILWGLEAVYVYELLEHADKASWSSGWGLVATPSPDPATWRPKPAYSAVQWLMAEMADQLAGNLAPVPLRVAGPDDLQYVLTAHEGGTHKVILWRRVSSYDVVAGNVLDVPREPVTIEFVGRDGQLRTVDIELGDAPAVVSLDGGL